LPGSEEAVASAEQAAEWARTIGYPVLIKAAVGGGGRGMHVAREAAEMTAAFEAASREAMQTFGSQDLYVEKLLPDARHIEFQILVDHSGKALHLAERECSIQRRYQKILEESPSPSVQPETRRQLGAQLERVLSRIGYTNAGTAEFLMDDRGKLYFIEMNTRLQVEHPVTELVTGIDLVKSQILLAAGAPVPEIAQGQLCLRGHSIECRVNAEDPATFAPSSGRITSFHVPGGTGVRVDSAAYTECFVHPYYDSLLAKLLVHGRNRQEALSRMSRALEMFIVEGVQTSIPLHRKILDDPDFLRGDYNLRFLERYQSRPALAAVKQ
jgi:acetyl-CoA carboxylase biotin carboxylase subunit